MHETTAKIGRELKLPCDLVYGSERASEERELLETHELMRHRINVARMPVTA